MRRIFGGLLAVLTFTTLAQAASSFELATQLGSVLSSEKLCGLAYDQAAISKWIEANVPADDMDFTDNLNAVISVASYRDMEPSQQTAHCVQISRVAKSFGFTQ